MASGIVQAIHVADEAAGPVRAVPRRRRMPAGPGGDRYTRGEGTFSDPDKEYELTLIEAEVIEAAAEYGMRLAPGESRRNITTRGIRLNDLVGKRFRVGDALCEGTRLCEPCAHLEAVTGRGGICRVLAGRGGLRARLLEGGLIRAGDPVTPEEETMP
jgi:MOSC domain-containing protein YiiM